MERRISHEQYAAGVSSNAANKHVLKGVMNLSKQIHQTTKNVVSQREICAKLNRKIQGIVADLQSFQTTSFSNGTMTKKIQDLEEILLTYTGLLDACGNADKSKQIFSDSHFKRTFDTLSKRLDDYKHNLRTGVVYHKPISSGDKHKEGSSTPKPKHCFGQCQRVFFFQPGFLPASPCAHGNCNQQSACFLNGRRVRCNQVKNAH